MHATGLATEQTADRTCETLLCDNLKWIEQKLEEIGDPCTPENRRQAKCFKALLENQRRKLNDLRRGERDAWCNDCE
jgi:hypothetical protein